VTIFDSDVTFSMLDSQALGGNFPGESNSAAIQLLSDAIIPASGGVIFADLAKPTSKAGRDCRHDKVCLLCFEDRFRLGRQMGLPRESAVAIEAGSVW